MKVLILADEPTWIIARLTDRMITGLPEFEFTKRFYIGLPPAEFVALANEHDLVHYQNWMLPEHAAVLEQIHKPVLMSIRSHRYPAHARVTAGRVRRVHAITPSIQAAFPGSTYIPDGLLLEPRPLRVGFAGKPGSYKGTDLIERACREIGAEYCPAHDFDPCQMYTFYRDIDVLVCASENEGFGTPVMEALALNKPVVSVRCGAAWEAWMPGVTWVDRTVEDIKDGLIGRWSSRHLEPFTWGAVLPQFAALYREVAD